MARQRFFSPVLVRGEEDKGVRIWGYGKMVYEQLLNLVLNPEYGDITDTETGTDLVLHYGKPAGASFPQTKLTPRRRSSKTPAEVGDLLDAFLLGEEGTTEDTATTTPPPSTDTVSSVDAAFNELMGA
jgi:hypothetical protein